MCACAKLDAYLALEGLAEAPRLARFPLDLVLERPDLRIVSCGPRGVGCLRELSLERCDDGAQRVRLANRCLERLRVRPGQQTIALRTPTSVFFFFFFFFRGWMNFTVWKIRRKGYKETI
jgi:hypothetical protein